MVITFVDDSVVAVVAVGEVPDPIAVQEDEYDTDSGINVDDDTSPPITPVAMSGWAICNHFCLDF